MIPVSLKFAPRCESYFGLVPMAARPVIRGSNQSGVVVKIAFRHDYGINLNWRQSSLQETHCGGYVPLRYPLLTAYTVSQAILYLVVSCSWERLQGRQSSISHDCVILNTAEPKKHTARTIIEQQWTPKLNNRDLFVHKVHEYRGSVDQWLSIYVTGKELSPTKLHLECPFMLG